MTNDAIIERIKAFSLFQGLVGDKEKLKVLASIMTPRSAKSGTYLFTEGDDGDVSRRNTFSRRWYVG